jgi:hypothetical protein
VYITPQRQPKMAAQSGAELQAPPGIHEKQAVLAERSTHRRVLQWINKFYVAAKAILYVFIE